MSDRTFFRCSLVALLVATAAGAQPDAAEATRAASALRRLQVEQAVAQALRNNPGHKVSELDVLRAQEALRGEEGRYPFVFLADAGFTRSDNPRLGPNDSVSSSVNRTYALGSALRKTWATGTAAEVRVEGRRFENDITTNPAQPSTVSGTGYNTTARASVTQPLLRGAGTGVGELELRAARASRSAADRGLARDTSALVRDVLTAYWELWYAGRATDIERNALATAKRQEAEAEARVAAGAVAPADVLSFNTRVAQLEEAVVGADISREQRALAVLELMGDTSDTGQGLLATSSLPPARPLSTRRDVEAALRSDSVELATLEAQLVVARTRAEYAGEQSRPRLDLSGYLESNGVSEALPRSFARTGQMGWVTGHVGLTFELPLDDSRRQSEKSAALLNVRIAETQIRAARQRIGTDASLAVARETAAARRLALAERTFDVAKRTHEAERARFELGQSIPIQVQQAEDDLKQAELRVTRARVDMVQSQIQLDHLTGRLIP